ncbi:interleukin-6-like [Xyrauchen texanus]|uniref:interleukin-6-like n=1 Tax=Xyrauchen texanus TaxID=154827 RepID=UPI0022427391|nr:interleukin-6-like [Xyrauchen texanus]
MNVFKEGGEVETPEGCSADAAVFLSLTSAVFLRVTDAAALYSSMGGLSETSGEELQHADIKSPPTEWQKWHLMARQLHKDVKTLQDEQFEKDFTETLNMTSYEDVRISTPILKHSDGCFSKNFSTERCLRRIYSVLMWYKEHLSYTERENLTSTLMNNVKHGTKRLLECINSQVRDLEVEGISSTLPPVASAWTSKVVARLDPVQLHQRHDGYMPSDQLHEPEEKWTQSPRDKPKETQ